MVSGSSWSFPSAGPWLCFPNWRAGREGVTSSLRSPVPLWCPHTALDPEVWALMSRLPLGDREARRWAGKPRGPSFLPLFPPSLPSPNP